MKLGRYGLGGEVIDCTIFDYVTDKPYLYMDYANVSTNEWTADQVFATGGSGAPRRIVFNSNKNSTLTFETQIFTLKHLALVAGREITSETGKNIYKREVLVVKEETVDIDTVLQVTLSNLPIDTNNDGVIDSEDVAVFTYVNGVDDTEVVVESIDGKDVILSGVEKDDEVVVYYQWQTTEEAHTLTFTSSDFPKYVKIVGDTILTDEVAGDVVSGQLVYYKAKLQPTFTLTAANSGDPTTITMVFDVFAADVAGKSVMADITLYDE